MQITKGIRKGNVVEVEKIEFEDINFLNEINKKEVEGLLLNSNNEDLYFIENNNYYIELQSTLEQLKEFLNVFANSQPIGNGAMGPVLPDPALVQSANLLNLEIDKLIKKIP